MKTKIYQRISLDLFYFQPLDSELTICSQEPHSPQPVTPCKLTVDSASDDDEDEYGNKKPKKPEYK